MNLTAMNDRKAQRSQPKHRKRYSLDSSFLGLTLEQTDRYGFSLRQRAAFDRALMRFGLCPQWKEIMKASHHLRKKTDEELHRV